MTSSTKTVIVLAIGTGAALAAGVVTRSRADVPHHALPVSANGNLVVGLCDGETSLEVAGVKEGTALSPAQARAVSDALMAEWRKKNPDARWDDAAAEPVQLAAAEGSSDKQDRAPIKSIEPGTAPPTQDGIYSGFTNRDERVWQAATDDFVQLGNKIFHDANAFGGTIGVSCDMCHPNAANTHPETYPKFQVQFGRVALLRDMINWCIENPTRGKPLHDDDPRLKAMEAYILAQRKGVKLDYGKH